MSADPFPFVDHLSLAEVRELEALHSERRRKLAAGLLMSYARERRLCELLRRAQPPGGNRPPAPPQPAA